MILDIRGGLGMQVLELIVGLTKARMKNEIIDEIRINTGGNVVSTVKHNYISKLFTLPIPVTISDGVLKQNAWTPENFELLADFSKGFKIKIAFGLTLRSGRAAIDLVQGVLQVWRCQGRGRRVGGRIQGQIAGAATKLGPDLAHAGNLAEAVVVAGIVLKQHHFL